MTTEQVLPNAQPLDVDAEPSADPAGGPRHTWAIAWGWWLRPMGQFFVSLAAVIVVAFLLVKLIPGDPVVIATNGRVSGEELEAARSNLGLDDPWLVQFGNYIGQLVQFNLGTSISTGRPILPELATRVPATLELVLAGLFFAIIATVFLSYLVVSRPTWLVSRSLRTYARSAGAIPEYVVGIAFLFVFYAVLRWAPAPSGRLDPLLTSPPFVTGFPVLDALIVGDTPAAASYMEHLVLPVFVMVVAHTALLMKSLVLSLDDAVDDPATRFRIASGARRSLVVASIFRRAAPPAIAMLGMVFGVLLGGAVVLESLFGLGGLGQFAVDAVNSSDVYALRSFLIVAAAICLFVYMLADILTMVVDPRRRARRNGAH